MAKKTFATSPNLDKDEIREYWNQDPLRLAREPQPKAVPQPEPVAHKVAAHSLPARVMLDHLDELQERFHCVIVGYDLTDLAQAKVIVRLL